MIRRSTVIAVVAILLSLSVHFVGLSVTSNIQPERLVEEATNNVVALGNAFEDVAETLPEPVPPENTPTPEPELETVPKPELADTPTNEVLVASPNPQRTNSPDTGTAQVVQPDTTGPSESEQGQIPEPESIEPSGGEPGTTTDVPVTPPVEPETVAEAPKGSPDGRVKPVTAEAVLSPPVALAPKPDAPQRLAALPVPVTPALPVTPAPVPSVVPVIPLERETVAAETPETTVKPTPEDPDTVEAIGQSDGSTEFSELLFPPLIVSPLTAYLRDGTEPNIRQNGRAQSGGLGFLDSRGPGNSDVTNYAGQVLVHLNRAPTVHVSGRGSARVLFEINPDGTLGRIDIIDSTGSPDIARAAKAQVRRAAPFPRPPKGVIRRLAFVYWNN